jgi:NAD-dependent dihydropyrimidine dehydrogenase PreA subunit
MIIDRERTAALQGDEAMAGMIWVDVEKCLGCGACVEACPAELIDLEAGKAVIAEQGCDGCLRCIEACPSGALCVVPEPHPAILVPIPSSGYPAAAAARGEKPGQFGGWAAAAIVLFAQEFAPRLAEALVRALDRPRSAPVLTTRPGSMSVETVHPWVGGMRRRRWRRRGGVTPAAESAAKTRWDG